MHQHVSGTVIYHKESYTACFSTASSVVRVGVRYYGQRKAFSTITHNTHSRRNASHYDRQARGCCCCCSQWCSNGNAACQYLGQSTVHVHFQHVHLVRSSKSVLVKPHWSSQTFKVRLFDQPTHNTLTWR